MRWKVEVCGNSFDLESLETAVSGLGAQAFKDGDKTFLYAEAFEHMDTAAEVNDAAAALLTTINASLRLSDTAAQPLTVGAVVDATGASHQFVSVQGAILRARTRFWRATVTVEGDAIRPPPPTEPILAKHARLINSDAEVAQAVKFLNAPDKTLVSLAKAYEVVKGDLGQGDHKLGGQRAAAISGVDEQDLFDFLENAAYPALSGDLSRHAGKNKTRKPKTARTMSHAEATDLVRRVVLAWIDAKQ